MATPSNGTAREGVKNAAVGAAVIFLFVAPYALLRGDSPGRYLFADLGLVLLFVWRFRGDALRRLGLSIPPRQLAGAALALVAGIFLARVLIGKSFLDSGIEIEGRHPLFSLSQVLHQEIVLRGILLLALKRWFRSRTVLAGTVALGFAGVHLIYFWIQEVDISLAAVTTLFLFGFATNLLFLQVEHIAFSFTAHAAWNVARFGTIYILGSVYVSEAESFAAIEGSGIVLAAAAGFLGATVLTLKLLDRRLLEG